MQEQLALSGPRRLLRATGAVVQVLWVLPVAIVCFAGVPAVAYGLVVSGRPASVVLGGLVGALWLVLVVVAIRKRRQPRSPAPLPPGRLPN